MEEKMTVIKVANMHCEKCVERISKAFEKAELEYQVNLADRTVSIDGCEHCVTRAKEILEDLGF